MKYSVNTNLFNCKTITQWEKVGQNQCTLRGDQSRTKLSGAEVLLAIATHVAHVHTHPYHHHTQLTLHVKIGAVQVSQYDP